jgi:hypothetical protein
MLCTVVLPIVVSLGLTTGGAGEQGSKDSSDGRQDILNYQLTLPRANQCRVRESESEGAQTEDGRGGRNRRSEVAARCAPPANILLGGFEHEQNSIRRGARTVAGRL